MDLSPRGQQIQKLITKLDGLIQCQERSHRTKLNGSDPFEHMELREELIFLLEEITASEQRLERLCEIAARRCRVAYNVWRRYVRCHPTENQ